MVQGNVDPDHGREPPVIVDLIVQGQTVTVDLIANSSTIDVVNGQTIIDAIVSQGAPGDPGVIISDTPPTDHSKLWVDTSGL